MLWRKPRRIGRVRHRSRCSDTRCLENKVFCCWCLWLLLIMWLFLFIEYFSKVIWKTKFTHHMGHIAHLSYLSPYLTIIPIHMEFIFHCVHNIRLAQIIFINLNLHHIQKHSFKFEIFWLHGSSEDFKRLHANMVSQIFVPPSTWRPWL
jgi:hypothetical protein